MLVPFAGKTRNDRRPPCDPTPTLTRENRTHRRRAEDRVFTHFSRSPAPPPEPNVVGSNSAWRMNLGKAVTQTVTKPGAPTAAPDACKQLATTLSPRPSRSTANCEVVHR